MSKKNGTESSKNSFKEKKKSNNENEIAEFDQEIEIVLIGNKFVGKTSVLFQFTTDMYTEPYLPTIGMDYRAKVVETHNGKKVRVKLWDTSGVGSSMESIAQDLYKLAAGFLVIYDVTDVQSYNDVFHWMNLIENNALDKAQIVIIGNKIDLKQNREISKEEGMYMASCYEAKYMEISANRNRNIDKMFKRMISNICDKPLI